MLSRPLSPMFVILVSLVLAFPSASAQQQVGFEEEFALASDRTAVLEKLIPGTEAYYYYSCLHAQNEGRLEEVDPLLRTWTERHGRSQQVEEIENRQALLRFDEDPDATLRFLRGRLGLNHGHVRQDAGAEPTLPTRLDPEQIAWKRLQARALSRHQRSLAGFHDSALERLAGVALDEVRRADWLGRLDRPDVPGLAAMVVQDLARRGSGGFGEYRIHSQLLLDQLDDCAARRPSLLGDEKFVTEVLDRLQPATGVHWESDAAERRAYLERLEAFTRRLPRSMSSLHAHVLFHRLVDDQRRGEVDKARFMEFLRLPRNASWVDPDHQRRQGGQTMVDLSRSFPTGFAAVRDDEDLVRSMLAEFFRTEDSIDPYREFVRKRWLERLLAETKILLGQGDMERWYSLLGDPSLYERLRERVEIEFCPTQPRFLGVDDPVVLDVDLKNVQTLLVKVFEIDTFNYYRDKGKEVDASIDLDGLVANEERTERYEDHALRRVRRQFEFSSIDRAGVFVVELIGNGTSSRALVRKGQLRMVDRIGSAGHVLRVVDEQGELLSEASAWIEGREYAADEDGDIVIPYTSQQIQRRKVVLRHGTRASLTQLWHRSETYSLHAGVLLDREALLPGQTARLLVRPTLQVNGDSTGLDLLEDVVLSLASRDHDGVETTQDIRGFELFNGRESVHEFKVPDNLASLTVRLRGRVQHLGRGEAVSLSTSGRQFTVNGMAATEWTACPLLGRSPDGYILDLLGKNGEPQAGRPVKLVFEHRHFTDPVEVQLKTDERGRIVLGELADIVSVRASGFPSNIGAWHLQAGRRSQVSELRATVGEELRVALAAPDGPPSRQDVSLLEHRNQAFYADRLSHARVEGGALVLRDLPAGAYTLSLKQSERTVSIQIVAGQERDGWLLGSASMLETGPREPLLLTSIRSDASSMDVQLRSPDRDTRVHVFSSRYLPAYDPYQMLEGPGLRARRDRDAQLPKSTFHSGRAIGDEYRYILDRRYAKKYAGNMLERPGLLLNPWAREETDTVLGMGGGSGGRFGSRAARGLGGGAAGAKRVGGRAGVPPGTFAQLDFLPLGTRLVVNLRPDENGRVSVPRSQLGEGSLVHVVALSRGQTVYATHTLEETELQPRDRSLQLALAADRHFTEQRQVEFVERGQEVEIADLATSQMEPYDSLAAVFQLFSTLHGSGELETFSFVLNWPELDEKQKRALYSEHACHELHFFLSQKDPDFFEAVVRPHLHQKMHKTFMDRWLLEEDLSGHLEPWAFGRLNIVERILLARRLEGQRESVARHVKDLEQLLVDDADRSRRHFETALLGTSLSATKGLSGRMAEARKLLAGGGRSAYAGPGSPGPDGARFRNNVSGKRNEPEADADLALEEEVEEFEVQDELNEGKDRELRDSVRPLYRRPDRTREYVEHNYWHQAITEQTASLIDVNAFWRDFADADPDRPFFSVHLAEAAGNVAEMMFALAVLDLPFEAAEHGFEIEGTSGRLTAASPLLLVRKELMPATPAGENSPVLVSQNFYRLDDRYYYEGNQQREKYVRDEFLVGTVYGCQVVLTNPTATPRRLELLLQIPQGSIPVQSGFQTRGLTADLGAWGTQAYEYHFYFPRVGQHSHYPVHVAKDGQLVAFVEAVVCNVVLEPSDIDLNSWEYISQNGTAEQLYASLDRENLHRLDLGRIAWRMRDRAVYDGVLERLRRRKIYEPTLWSYSLLHGDVPAIRETLRHRDDFMTRCGRALECTLVSLDPVERRTFQHVEYRPLINPRAHRFGREYRILNSSLAGQYRAFLEVQAYRPELGDLDWMSAAYYLLLQDRVEDALQAFSRVRRTRLELDVQYDYMRAYLDFFNDEPREARRIAESYRDYPVDHWRVLFDQVLAHLDEAEGRARGGGGLDTLASRQDVLAASEPSLEMAMADGGLTLRHRNVGRVELRFYEMDVEFLFSSSPFVQQGVGSFAYVRPNHSKLVSLGTDEGATQVALPAEIRNSNVLVEVRGEGLTQRHAQYANSLAVQVMEHYGQLRVTHAETGELLPRVYVKVYARMPGGEVRFHKDGYTDLRGRFDYASISGEGPGPERFSVLILSEGEGAVIREVAPPLQ